jgi:hypothetical protein
MKIECPKCGGRGTVQLPEYLAQTLEIVESLPGSETSEVYASLALKHGLRSENVSTVNNRLNALMELHLVYRLGNGSRYNPYRWFSWEEKQ